MFDALPAKKRFERLPEDSGEWTPVPLQYRRLTPPPPVWGRREATTDRKLPLKSWAYLLVPLQLALGAGAVFLGACLPDGPDSVWWLFVTPGFVGFFSALCVPPCAIGTLTACATRGRMTS